MWLYQEHAGMLPSSWLCQGAEGIVWRWICSAIQLLWWGHVHSEMQILVLLSAELCREEKALPGSAPISSHLCFRVHAQFDSNVFGRNGSLCNHCGFHPLLPFLSVMFAWSPCGTQPDGSCAFLLATACTHAGVRSHLRAWQ